MNTRPLLATPSRRRLLAALAAFLATAMALPAQEAPATPSPSPAPKDYSKGFQQFYALGLPDSAKARYVKVDVYSRDPMEMMSSSSLYDLRLVGNGWMLDETPREKGRFIVDLTRVVEVVDSDAANKERQKRFEDLQKTNQQAAARLMMLGRQSEDDSRTLGKWKAADAKKDVDRILEVLRKNAEESPENRRGDRFSYNNGYGQLLLMACHFHRAGFTNEANQLAGLLFESAGDPRKIILQGMNVLADSRYNAALAALRKTGDWAAFLVDLDALNTKFASSWKQAPLVKRLSEKVRARAATPPDIAGDGITDEDKAIAADLASAQAASAAERFYSPYGDLWIFPPEKDYAARLLSPSIRKNPLTRIRLRGMKAIPLLLALLKDEHLVAVASDSSSRSHYYWQDGEAITESVIDKRYAQMNRPFTRGELAADLLRPLPPKPDDPRRRPTENVAPAELYDEVKAWYDASKDKTPLALAREYFTDGGRQQRSYALQYLMKHGEDADFAVIEKSFLESNRPTEIQHEVQSYVRSRGDKASEFLGQFEAKIKAASSEAGGDKAAVQDKRYQKMMLQQFEQLKAETARPRLALKETLDRIASGEDSLSMLRGHFYEEMNRTTNVAQSLTLVLDAAARAVDGPSARDLLSIASTSLARGNRAAEVQAMMADMDPADLPPEFAAEMAGQAETAAKDPLKPPDHAAQWTKLLADTRPLTTAPGPTMTVGDYAAITMDTMYAGIQPSFGAKPDARHVMGREAIGIYRARAEALLAGKAAPDLPRFPEIEMLDAPAKKALADRILAMPPADLPAALKALKPGERIALSGQARRNDKLSAHLAPWAMRVASVEGDESFRTELTSLGAAKDKPLARDTLRFLSELVRKATAQGRVVRASASRGAYGSGVTLVIHEVKPGGREYRDLFNQGEIGRNATAQVDTMIAAPKCAATAVWTLAAPAAPAAPAKPPAAGADDDAILNAAAASVEAALIKAGAEEQAGFWKAADDFCAGKGNVCNGGVVLFMGKPVCAPPAEPARTSTTTPAAPAAAH